MYCFTYNPYKLLLTALIRLPFAERCINKRSWRSSPCPPIISPMITFYYVLLGGMKWKRMQPGSIYIEERIIRPLNQNWSENKIIDCRHHKVQNSTSMRENYSKLQNINCKYEETKNESDNIYCFLKRLMKKFQTIIRKCSTIGNTVIVEWDKGIVLWSKRLYLWHITIFLIFMSLSVNYTPSYMLKKWLIQGLALKQAIWASYKPELVSSV